MTFEFTLVPLKLRYSAQQGSEWPDLGFIKAFDPEFVETSDYT